MPRGFVANTFSFGAGESAAIAASAVKIKARLKAEIFVFIISSFNFVAKIGFMAACSPPPARLQEQPMTRHYINASFGRKKDKQIPENGRVLTDCWYGAAKASQHHDGHRSIPKIRTGMSMFDTPRF